MNRYRILLCLLFLCNIAGFAQTIKPSVAGSVRDKNGRPIFAATVTLLKKSDSAVLAAVISDSTGYFRFSAPSTGSYLISTTSTGYLPFAAAIAIRPGDTAIQVPVIMEMQKTPTLQDAVVTGKKNLFVRLPDKLVMNVDALISNTGSNVLDLLQKVPALTVDKDDNISLNGKQYTLIMIDGKPTYLSGTALASLLRSMNADQVNQIEIMTNPNARYDAAGSSGIINIITKRNRMKGWNGDISLGYGQGVYWKTFNSFDLYYNVRKFNFFLNYGLNAERSFFNNTNHQDIFQGNGLAIANFIDQFTHYNSVNVTNNIKAGVDYALSKKTTIGVILSGFTISDSTDYLTTAELKDGAAHLDSLLTTYDNTHVKWHNVLFDLNAAHRFDSLRELSGDLNYIRYTLSTGQNVQNNTLDSSLKLIAADPLRISIPMVIDVYAGKLDYSMPVSKGTKLETGGKISYVRTQSSSDYFTRQPGGEMTFNDSLSNQFHYDENIDAAYLRANRETGKWNLQAGLRYEYTYGKGSRFGNILVSDSTFRIHYGNLFPSFFISYKASASHSITLSMSRRIDRPSYQNLNPFVNYVSKYVLDKGNPFLQPQYTYNLELNHNFKGVLFTTLGYSYTSHYFGPVLSTVDNITVATADNLGSSQTVGLTCTAQLTFTPWWSGTVTAYGSYTTQNGDPNGAPINSNFVKGNFNGSTQFKVPGGWSFELSGYYNTRSQFAQLVINGAGDLSAGASKSFLQGKAILKVNVRDILYTNIFDTHINIDGASNYQRVEEHFVRRSDSRRVNISFNYRFGSSHAKSPNHENGGSEEQRRVGH